MKQLITVYKCFCDETRLRVLNLLRLSPLCVCHLQALLGVSQVNMSRHLAYLRRHGMVNVIRHQNWNIYSLPDARPPLLDRNLQCLQDLTGEIPQFRKDLAALKALLRDREVRGVIAGRDCPLPDPSLMKS